METPAADAGPAAAAPAGEIDAAAMRRVWDEVVATVGQRSKRAAAVAREATVREVEGNTIVLWFQHGVHANMLAAAPEPVLDAVHQVLGGTWQLRCEARDHADSGRPGGGAGARKAASAGPATPPTTAPPAPPAVTRPAASGPDDDWPEPVRPGAAAAGATAPASATPPDPEPAPVSGSAPPPPRDSSPAPLDPEAAGVDLDRDERTGAGTSEQQALELLQRTLGAEKIGEVAP